MNVDVIMLTNSNTHFDITNRNTVALNESETEYKFNVILVESGEMKNYNVYRYIKLDGPFNYNKCINLALHHVTSPWVIISNNDVGYERGWFSEIMRVHNMRPDIESFSPKDPMMYMKYYPWNFVGGNDEYWESYIVTQFVAGWCLVIKKNALDKIIPFDEQFDMYYQDNDYAEMLKLHHIKHALCRHSIAVHEGTLRMSNRANQQKLNEDELKFRTKWNIW